jgi:hypothetical protein
MAALRVFEFTSAALPFLDLGKPTTLWCGSRSGKLLHQPFREGVPQNIGTDCHVSIDRASRYIEAVPLFWLNYHHPDGHFAVVAVVEAMALIQARMKAAVTGLDQGLEFALGHELDEESARQIPADMIGRLLDDSDLRR